MFIIYLVILFFLRSVYFEGNELPVILKYLTVIFLGFWLGVWCTYFLYRVEKKNKSEIVGGFRNN